MKLVESLTSLPDSSSSVRSIPDVTMTTQSNALESSISDITSRNVTLESVHHKLAVKQVLSSVKLKNHSNEMASL